MQKAGGGDTGVQGGGGKSVSQSLVSRFHRLYIVLKLSPFKFRSLAQPNNGVNSSDLTHGHPTRFLYQTDLLLYLTLFFTIFHKSLQIFKSKYTMYP